MFTLTPCVSPQLAWALAGHLCDAVAASEHAGLPTFTEGAVPASDLCDGEELAAAHDLLLRVLRGVSDPLDWRILSAVISDCAETESEPKSTGFPLDAIADTLELPRLVVTERIRSLVRLGLVACDPEHNNVGPSPAGSALFELICELDAEIARWLSHRRKT